MWGVAGGGGGLEGGRGEERGGAGAGVGRLECVGR